MTSWTFMYFCLLNEIPDQKIRCALYYSEKQVSYSIKHLKNFPLKINEVFHPYLPKMPIYKKKIK